MIPQENMKIALVTGSTGYIGSELIHELLKQGWAVKALSRSREKAKTTSWGFLALPQDQPIRAGHVQIIEGELTDVPVLRSAFKDVDAAWYLVHAMGDGNDFRREDRRMAQSFIKIAEEEKLPRLVYLSGLHPEKKDLSDHLASRVEVGQIFLDSKVPTAVLQAGVVLGKGSSSFTMLRHLSERLPGAIGPQWITNLISPISIRDALFFLVNSANLSSSVNRTFDIGGPEALGYHEMLKRYARAVLGRRRLVFTAPVTTPRLAAHWISLVTPVKKSLAAPLLESLVHDTVVKERDLESLVGRPQRDLQTFEEAVTAAVSETDTGRWARTLLTTCCAIGACAALGSFMTNPQSRWYRSLSLPSWQPSPAVFPVVWTGLYVSIATISSLVIADAQEEGDKDMGHSYMKALGLNLILNAGWCGLFFRARKLRVAALEASVLAVSSADLMRRAFRSSPERGVALIPYSAWTAGAAILSGTIAWMNRSPKGQ